MTPAVVGLDFFVTPVPYPQIIRRKLQCVLPRLLMGGRDVTRLGGAAARGRREVFVWRRTVRRTEDLGGSLLSLRDRDV